VSYGTINKPRGALSPDICPKSSSHICFTQPTMLAIKSGDEVMHQKEKECIFRPTPFTDSRHQEAEVRGG